MGITLEKVDQVIERTGVSYAEAKSALESCNEDVLEAIIFIEKQREDKKENKYNQETIQDFKKWLKDLINKGNVTRIRIKKDEKEIVDIPVNAGIAAGVIAVIIPQVLAFLVIAAVVTKITIEITMADGSVEVVNKYITKTVGDIKDAATDAVDKVKDKVSEVKKDRDLGTIIKEDIFKKEKENEEESMYSYTVNFEEVKEKQEKEDNEE